MEYYLVTIRIFINWEYRLVKAESKEDAKSKVSKQYRDVILQDIKVLDTIK